MSTSDLNLITEQRDGTYVLSTVYLVGNADDCAPENRRQFATAPGLREAIILGQRHRTEYGIEVEFLDPPITAEVYEEWARLLDEDGLSQ